MRIARTCRNFDVDLQLADGEDLRIGGRSAAGDAHTSSMVDLGLARRYQDFLHVAFRDGRTATIGPEKSGLRRIASSLSDSLFVREVRELFLSTLDRAGERDTLRIRLRIHDPALLALPWELLLHPRTGLYLGSSRLTPVLRHIPLGQPVAPHVPSGQFHVLAVAASPGDLSPLDIAEEREVLSQAFCGAEASGGRLTWLEDATLEGLREALLREDFHALHFASHADIAGDDGVLALMDARGRRRLVDGARLAALLANHPHLRFVVLNACKSGMVAADQGNLAMTLVQAGQTAVVAMQFSVSDETARDFTSTFYKALARGLPIDGAVAEARLQLFLENRVDFAAPVLYLRSDASAPLAVEEPPESPPAPAGVDRSGAKDRSHGAPDHPHFVPPDGAAHGAPGAASVMLIYADRQSAGAGLDDGEAPRAALEVFLAPLVLQGSIRLLGAHMLSADPGGDRTLNAWVQTADLVLLLVTPGFFANPRCRQLTALALSGPAVVLPVLVSSTDYQHSDIARLVPAPRNRIPVYSWRRREEAWTEVAKVVRHVVAQILSHREKART